mgnify:CR=1 FL=1
MKFHGIQIELIESQTPGVCAHFGIHGRCGIILPQLRLRGQLQNRTALTIASPC